MSEPTRRDVLRFCFWGSWNRSLAGRIAVIAAWCLALGILCFNALFGLMFEDANLVIRGVPTLILAAPLVWLYFRGKRSLAAS